jgi:hypothetical protein
LEAGLRELGLDDDARSLRDCISVLDVQLVLCEVVSLAIAARLAKVEGDKAVFASTRAEYLNVAQVVARAPFATEARAVAGTVVSDSAGVVYLKVMQRQYQVTRLMPVFCFS